MLTRDRSRPARQTWVLCLAAAVLAAALAASTAFGVLVGLWAIGALEGVDELGVVLLMTLGLAAAIAAAATWRVSKRQRASDQERITLAAFSALLAVGGEILVLGWAIGDWLGR